MFQIIYFPKLGKSSPDNKLNEFTDKQFKNRFME